MKLSPSNPQSRTSSRPFRFRLLGLESPSLHRCRDDGLELRRRFCSEARCSLFIRNFQSCLLSRTYVETGFIRHEQTFPFLPFRSFDPPSPKEPNANRDVYGGAAISLGRDRQ